MLNMRVKCSEDDYYEKWLRLILLNQFTDVEFKIMASIVKVGECTTVKKKRICKDLNISLASFNNYISKLTRKGLLKRNGRSISINPKLEPDGETEVVFRFDIQ